MAPAILPAVAVAPLRVLLGSRSRHASSLAVWSILQVLDIPFEESTAPLERPDGDSPLQHHGSASDVPVLTDRDVTVWGSLAILDHLAKRWPAIWPADRAARGQARSIAAECHAGFPALRAAVASGQPRKASRTHLTAEIRRIQKICATRRAACRPDSGPFLFGAFTAADAMLVPLMGPMVAQGLSGDQLVSAYLAALRALPALRAWFGDDNVQDTPAIGILAVELPPVVEPAAPATTLILSPNEPEPTVLVSPPPPPPLLRLEDVDRPMIAYLDETPARGWRILPAVERLSAPPPIPPLPTRAATASTTEHNGDACEPLEDFPRRRMRERSPTIPNGLDHLARRSTDIKPQVLPTAAGPPPDPIPAPKRVLETEAAGPEPLPAEAAGPDEGSFMFRLRRPGAPAAEQPARLANRFGRMITLGRSEPRKTKEPVAADLLPDAPAGEAAKPGRPASGPIKPIGFSMLRRR